MKLTTLYRMGDALTPQPRHAWPAKSVVLAWSPHMFYPWFKRFMPL